MYLQYTPYVPLGVPRIPLTGLRANIRDRLGSRGGLGFWSLGLRDQGLGFWSLGLRDQGLGFRRLGFRDQGWEVLEFRA